MKITIIRAVVSGAILAGLAVFSAQAADLKVHGSGTVAKGVLLPNKAALKVKSDMALPSWLMAPVTG